MRPKGFIIDVPVTLSVAVRGLPLDKAKELARRFANGLSPTQEYCDGYTQGIAEDAELSARFSGVSLMEATLESNREDSCEVLDELEAEEDEPEDGDAGRTFDGSGVVSVDWNQCEQAAERREAER